MAFERAGHAVRRLHGQARRARRHRRGADQRRRAPQPERAAAGDADGEVELLSTHDQLLGGPSGQSYLGCRFPADFAYAKRDQRRGRRSSASGWRTRASSAGSPSTSSSVKDADGEWTPYAIELNLRKGGTTHPFLTLQFLTDGRYDATTALFLTPSARRSTSSRPTTSSRESLRALSLDDLFDIVARHGLHFDQARQTGVVFHMISCLTEHGRVGLTAVGDTPAEAEALYQRAERMLLDEAALALAELQLPED